VNQSNTWRFKGTVSPHIGFYVSVEKIKSVLADRTAYTSFLNVIFHIFGYI
jgi:hypothetical protein